MLYVLPNFNLLANFWDIGTKPSLGAASHVDVAVQLYVNPKGALDTEYGTSWAWSPPIFIRIKSSDEAVWKTAGVVECPAGSGYYYLSKWKEWMHRGFPNEYLTIMCDQCTAAAVAQARFVDYTP